MKVLKAVLLLCAALIILPFLLFGINRLIGTRADVANRSSGKKIRQVQPGMSLEQVTALLGKPYEVRASQGLHDITCKDVLPVLRVSAFPQKDIRRFFDSIANDAHYCCRSNKEDKHRKELTLAYTRHLFFADQYPMLWVHLDSNYEVSSVFARTYNGLLGKNEGSFYSLSRARNEYELSGKKDKTELIIDKKTFGECFP